MVPTVSGRRLAFVALTAVALALSVAAAGPAGSQVGEVIHRYEVSITMERSGDLRVVERIAYDFGGTPRHGILREVPTRFHYDGRYDRLEPVSDVSVTASADTPVNTKVESGAGGRTVIRVGDPNRTITGVHTYSIAYRVAGAFNSFEDHDELYWNAIGDEWSVLIETATVQVTAPTTIARVACFAGPTQSRLSCAQAAADGSSATFSQTLLYPRSGMTVVVGVPKGAVTVGRPILEERWSITRAFSVTGATVGGAAALAVALLGGIVAVLWRGGRDRRFSGGPIEVAFGNGGGAEEAVPLGSGRHVPVEFEPPDKLRPGELGTLVDAVANPLDVTATIVDLAVRGYLRIEEVPKHGWRGKADWTLVQLREADDSLRPYERTLLDGIFTSGSRPEVNLSALRNTFASKLHEVQSQLYDDAMEHGWFVRRPDRARGFWVAIGILASIVGIAVLVLLTIKTHVALLGVPVALAGLLLLGGAHWMPRRTAKGYGVLQRPGASAASSTRARRSAPGSPNEEPVLRIPAVRHRVRSHGEVGASVRGPRRRAARRRRLVRRPAGVHRRRVHLFHRRLYDDDRRHHRIHTGYIRLERLLGGFRAAVAAVAAAAAGDGCRRSCGRWACPAGGQAGCGRSPAADGAASTACHRTPRGAAVRPRRAQVRWGEAKGEGEAVGGATGRGCLTMQASFAMRRRTRRS